MIKKNRKTPTNLITEIKDHLQSLKLKRISEILDEELALATQNGSAPTEVLSRLLVAEFSSQTERRIDRRIKESGLSERKLLSDYDFEFQTGVDKAQIMELATLSFIDRGESLIFAGDSGTGKSHIAKALLLIACQRQQRCRYTTAAEMLKTLYSSLCDDSLPMKLKAYVRPELLLIDELGLDRLEQENARNAALFHKVIEGRYCKNPTILTTNLSFEDLGLYLGDVVSTTATLDRMIHHSIVINIQGPSWRMHESTIINKTERSKTSKKKATGKKI